jgi:PAS domain S-box-containing protein
MKLTPRLAIVFILFATALLLGVGMLAYYSGRAALEAATVAELEATALEKSAALDTWTAERKADITALSHSPVILEQLGTFLTDSSNRKLAHDRLVRELAIHTVSGQPYLAFLILSPTTGEVLIGTNSQEEGKFKENRPYFTQGRLVPFVSKVYYSLELQAPAITASAPLQREDGQLLGVLVGRLNLEELNAIIQRRSGLRQTDDAFLVNTSNVFVTQPHLLPDPAVLQRGIHTQAVKQCLQNRSSGTLSALDYRNIPAIISYRWLPKYEMCMIVKVNQAEAFAPIQAFGRTIGWIALLTLATASIVALVLARSITRPVLAIQAVVQQYGRGDLETRLPEGRPDELGMLAHEFNQMAVALREKDHQLREYAAQLEKKVEERTTELKQSQERFAKAFHASPDAVIISRMSDGLILEVNEGWQRLFGHEPVEVLGKTSLELNSFANPEDRKNAIDILQRQGSLHDYELDVRCKSSEIRRASLAVEKIELNGTPCLLTILRDITERKQAEIKLRESEARYRGLIESQFDLIVRVDPQGRFTFVNDAYCQKFGLKREEVLGRESYQPLVHPEDLPHTLEAMQALYQPPYRAVMEQRAFTVEGLRWIEWQDSAIRDESDRIVEIQAIGRDITAHKQAESALRASEQRLNRAQEIAHLGSWELVVANHQLTWSDEVYRIFGLQPQEFAATYEAFLATVHPEDRAAVDAAYSGSIREGSDSYEIEHRIVKRSSGEIRYVHEKCEHLRDRDGQIIRSLGMVHDITERKRAEDELNRALEELQHSNTELEQFAYIASHDLQEPLRMVSSYVQLLRKRYQGRLDQDADEFITYAFEGATRMQNLINDLLAYSRVGTRGKPFVTVACENVLEEAMANLQIAIEESGASITHDPLPQVTGDPTQLIQLFQNLLSNAIKFRGSEPPRIQVRAQREQGEWVFGVSDNGIGLEAKFAERIFVIFQRLHDRASYPGTGIGLAICKRIVQRHGGRIWVESQPGSGATFYFTIPVKEIS